LSFFGNSDNDVYLAAALCFPVVIIGLTLFTRITSGYQSVSTWRNFYGVLTVSKKTIQNESVIYLKHGNIIHGDQFSGAYKQEPTMYFARQTGIGRVFTALERQQPALNVGIIGLGAGTLAAYGRKTDAITFYELNPQVVDIAKTQFSYLKDTPAQTKVILGDGRLSLEKELQHREKPFDLLVIDAFSDDAIPLHLLTKEAFIDYTRRITNEGMLALHISNNYIDLKPVLVRMAREFGLSYVFIHTKAHDVATETEWAFLSSDTNLFKNPAIKQVVAPADTKYKSIALWTDQKSNLFEILK
jgi:spermidine synthase